MWTRADVDVLVAGLRDYMGLIQRTSAAVARLSLEYDLACGSPPAYAWPTRQLWWTGLALALPGVALGL